MPLGMETCAERRRRWRRGIAPTPSTQLEQTLSQHIHNSIIRDTINVLHEPSQRIAVGHDEHGLARSQIGLDALAPERQRALHRVLEALGPRRGLEVGIISIFRHVERMIRGHGRWSVAQPVAPGLHARLAELFGESRFREAREATIMPLVEPPALEHRPVDGIEPLQQNPGAPNRASQARRVADVDGDARFQ